MSEAIDIETVEQTQALAVRPADTGMATLAQLEDSFKLAVRQRELLHDYINAQLKENQHYMKLPGAKKNVLLKEGAELVMLPHGLVPDYEIVSGPPTADDSPYQITVKCTLRRKGDPDSFAGSGIGSAGSYKGGWKYETRERNSPRHWEYEPRQTDKYLCHNATLKMAQKSAMISAVINCTAASEFFTQDMDEVAAPSSSAPAHAPASRPKQPSQPPAATSASAPKAATEVTRKWMIATLGDTGKDVLMFAIEAGWVMPNETLEDIPLKHVPTSKEQLKELVIVATNFVETGKMPVKPTHPHGHALTPPVEVPRDPEPAGSGEEWRDFPMPFGKNAGVPLAELEKSYLFGLWANFKVEDTYNGKPKRPETIAKDQKFREMLDQAGEHYTFTKKD